MTAEERTEKIKQLVRKAEALPDWALQRLLDYGDGVLAAKNAQKSA